MSRAVLSRAEAGTMSGAVLFPRVDWSLKASMLHTAHPQSSECVVLILATSPEHEKDRGKVTGLACLITAHSGRGGASRTASSNPTMTRGRPFTLDSGPALPQTPLLILICE